MAKWRHTTEYRQWRVSVIRRDKVCQVCHVRKSRQAHHINHATYFIEQRFDVKNGVCLCQKCHSQFHNNFIGNTRKMCRLYDYLNFIDLIKYIKGLT
jgi:5-methylcytosine-specific restriction endonuclease McrA